MRRTFGTFAISVFCTFMLCSCGQTNTSTVYRAATQVDVVTKYEGQLLHRHYNTPEKMRPILLYLRLLKPYGKPVPAEEAAKGEDMYLISILLSDGQRHYYRQVSHKYLAKENGPFKSIDPGQAAKLYGILRQFPSDAMTAERPF